MLKVSLILDHVFFSGIPAKRLVNGFSRSINPPESGAFPHLADRLQSGAFIVHLKRNRASNCNSRKHVTRGQQMKYIPWSKVLHIATGFAVGVAITSTQFAPAQRKQDPANPPPLKREDPENRALDANLYVQTSAEYRACCLQAYNIASSRLREEVGKLPKEQVKPPAVVMDLDETVFDNRVFQSMQLRSGNAYDQNVWDRWEENGAAQVRLVPGAKGFIQEARKLGIAVIYISNRKDCFRKQAKDALALLDIPITNEDHLKLAASTNDKTERRKEGNLD